MRSTFLATCICALFVAAWSNQPEAKNASDHFAEAAALYVQGRLQEAGNAVASGLRENPGDPKLASLDNLLKQLKDQQRQDQNSQGGGQGESDPKQQEDNKDSDKKNDSSQQDDKQQNKEQDQDQQAGKDQEKKDKPEDKQDQAASQQPDQDKKDQEARDSAQAAAEQPKPGQMSKDDAERLLNSFDQDEKQSQRERQAPKRRVIVEEDW
jgi:Ca-activated chloride channel homolog